MELGSDGLGVNIDSLVKGFQWVNFEIAIRGSGWSTKLRSLMWSGSLELLNSVERGVWCCPLVLCGLSTVLPRGVVVVVFWGMTQHWHVG